MAYKLSGMPSELFYLYLVNFSFETGISQAFKSVDIEDRGGMQVEAAKGQHRNVLLP